MAESELQFLPKPLEIDPVVWKHSVGGARSIDVTTQIYTNHEGVYPGLPTALVIPGYGEHAWAAKKGLAALAELGVPALAAVLNAEVVPATSLDIESFVNNVAGEVSLDLVERTGLEEDAPGLCHSLGGLVIARATKYRSGTFGDVAILEGVGTNGRALRDLYPKPKGRRQAYTRRFAHVIAGPHRATPNQTVQAGLSIFTQLAEDIWPPTEHRLRRQMKIASDADSLPLLIDHAQAGHTVMLITGQKDPLIKADEVRASLNAYLEELGDDAKDLDIKLFEADEKHAYMGFRAGKRHLQAAACGLGLAKTKRRDDALAGKL